MVVVGDPILNGNGEVFRRDQNRESLCSCDYGLAEGPLTTSRTEGNQYVAGPSAGLGGWLMPQPPMTLDALRMALDKKQQSLQLRLESGHWLDFSLRRDGQIIGLSALRNERGDF
jgi:hypothetical protein